MTDREVVESLDAAWLAMAKQYSRHPEESMRIAMNVLSKIIGKVKSEVEEAHREKQITIEEWIAMLEKGV